MCRSMSVFVWSVKAWAAVTIVLCGGKGVAQLRAPVESGTVQIQKESVVIPTYQVGAPDPVPMFYNHESYQGAQKRIYPYALQDHLTHQREDRTYTALRLENEFVRLTVLPELGGRLFSATDKTNNYDFFYQPARDQAGTDRDAGGLDLGRRRMVCVSPPPQHDVHAGGLHPGRASGRQQDDLVR